MAKIDLRIRDLKTDKESTEAFSDVDAARAWLAARPPFVDCLGVASANIDVETSHALRAMKRPLDAEESAAAAALDAVRALAAAEKEKKRLAEAMAEEEAHRKEMREADPNRPMDVRWTYDGGLTLIDSADPREVPAAAREALDAWIAERDEWVKDRGQIVGEVTATLWPNKVPDGAERIQRARFFPVTAPSPTEALPPSRAPKN